jgi:hypothetical protein
LYNPSLVFPKKNVKPFRSLSIGCTSGPWSDIDILVIVREESWPLRGEISTLAARVSLEYDVLIGPRVIGLERWEGMERDGFSLYRNITAEGVPLTPTPASS